MRTYYYEKKLRESERHSPSKLNADSVPRKMGLYAWFTKRGNRPVYVGKAIGRKGLYKRIISQHLNPDYLETRTGKHTAKDEFQLKYPTYKNGKIAIDKSAFRKNVARKKRLRAGKDSVSFLKRAYNVSFIVMDAQSHKEISELEKRLIAKWRPEFNISGAKTSK